MIEFEPDDDLMNTIIEVYDNSWDGYLTGMTTFDREKLFNEMAEVYPKYIKEKRPDIPFHVVVAQGGEGFVPHAHVYFRSKEDTNRKYISYICLHEAEYAPQHDDGKRLTNSEKKALVAFFNTFRDGAYTRKANGKVVPCNCWQECVDIWIATYSDKLFIRDEDGDIIMPDYTTL